MSKPFPGAAALLAAFLLAAPACKHADVHVTDTIEEAPRLPSTVRTADPATAGQLVSGFYDIEDKAWRWTAQKFAVNLRPPARAAQQGATLEFQFTIPKSSLDKLGSITLTATAGGITLPSETYMKAGEHTYRREVSATVLGSDTVRVDFALDKAIPPGDADKRELGVVAASIGLVAK